MSQPPFGPPSHPPPSYPPPPPPPPPPPTHEPPRSRRPVLLAVLGSALVLVLAVVVPVAYQQLSGAAERQAAVEANLDEVRDYPDLRRDHTTEDVDYPQVPPAGGPHDPVWLACGAYEEPVRDENAVHDLEHGTVWISYDPDLDDADLATLAGALPDNGILAPHDGLPAPVVVTVWGHQLRLTGADDPRLPLFVEEYGDGSSAPEPFASCQGGMRTSPDRVGGTPV